MNVEVAIKNFIGEPTLRSGAARLFITGKVISTSGWNAANDRHRRRGVAAETSYDVCHRTVAIDRM